MSDYTSTHSWQNGSIVTAEKIGDDINLRIQAPDENMLCDIVVGQYEATCIAHALLSVMVNGDE